VVVAPIETGVVVELVRIGSDPSNVYTKVATPASTGKIAVGVKLGVTV
jgi:hypothetical protein